VIIKWVLWGGVVWTGLIWLRIGTSVNTVMNFLVPKKYFENLEKVSHWWLLKDDPGSLNYINMQCNFSKAP
jgi:hypothetical protein